MDNNQMNGMYQQNIPMGMPQKKKGKAPFVICIIGYVVLIAAFVITVMMVSENKQKKYNKLVDDYNELGNQYNELASNYEDVAAKYKTVANSYNELKSENDKLSEEYQSLSNEYTDLFDKYYELVAETSVTYEKPTNLDEYDSTITYDNLARTPDEYEGKAIKMSGKVIQVMEGDSETHFRIALKNGYDDVVFVVCDSSMLEQRILEDDRVTFYGVSYGLYTYESTLGKSVTLPLILADYIERN